MADATLSEMLTAAKAAYYTRLAGGDAEEILVGGVSTRFGPLSRLKEIIDQMEVQVARQNGAPRPFRITVPGRYS